MSSPFNSGSISKICYLVLFRFARMEKGNDPETAEATMEGLAFPRRKLGNGVKNADRERGCFRIGTQAIVLTRNGRAHAILNVQACRQGGF
jgi:hypothetical protein